MQEVKRLGFTVSEADIDSAVLDVARQIKVSASNLSQDPDRQRRRRCRRCAIASRPTSPGPRSRRPWSVAACRFRRPTSMPQARHKLTAANSFDYILKEVLFIMRRQRQQADGRGQPVQEELCRAATAPCSSRSTTPTPQCATSAAATRRSSPTPWPTNSPSSMSAASPSRAWSRVACRCWRSAPSRRPRTRPYIANNIRQETGTQRHAGRGRQVSGRTQGQGSDRQGITWRTSPPIAISMGEPAGIGPDLILKLYANRAELDASALHRFRQHGLPRGARPAARPQHQLRADHMRSERPDSFPSPCPSSHVEGLVPDKPGDTSPLSGKVVIESISRAVAETLERRVPRHRHGADPQGGALHRRVQISRPHRISRRALRQWRTGAASGDDAGA